MTTNTSMTVQVMVNGRPVKQYQHDGRTYIEGKHGTEYTIRVHNNNSTRVCAVVSVDGLDVLTGKTATKDARGYVIGSWSYADIKGFRISDEEVGAFKFASKGKSYAASKGKAEMQNVGVIGVVAFTEKQKYVPPTIIYRDRYIRERRPMYPYPPDTYVSADTFWCSTLGGERSRSFTRDSINEAQYCANINTKSLCGDLGPTRGSATKARRVNLDTNVAVAAAGAAPDFDMGTSWGSKVADSVTTVDFERDYQLPLVTVYYASRGALKEVGIELDRKPAVEKLPQPFSGYAEPPKGW
jgi:hypothetical protein